MLQHVNCLRMIHLQAFMVAAVLGSDFLLIHWETSMRSPQSRDLATLLLREIYLKTLDNLKICSISEMYPSFVAHSNVGNPDLTIASNFIYHLTNG
ncbi:hypothetical protein TNIN_214651 [Trichonephila inaurata madagascariensis]|uniref:Uncharacterized protein n=1 Tax=Trichonephila inaurata madagascariensis TaxID=2747483 RepID=A0A8X6WXK0_9ARAC|nr:hypothetical protein TNIN_214651 [Trichonephila inaurata madagascariensis]